jgi:hypothetical protein
MSAPEFELITTKPPKISTLPGSELTSNCERKIGLE